MSRRRGGRWAAGIGGGKNGSRGTITINGGSVTATGGIYAAGIGGGFYGIRDTITISGGSVAATGGESAAGIGGGSYDSGGTITISGGSVTATGGGSAAGIGGGYNGRSGGTITISGGSVTATGGESAAGIGGGYNGSGGTITISGGSVTATTDGVGEGIGWYGVSGDNVGTFSTGENGNAVIYASSINATYSEDDLSGIIFNDKTGKVYGDITFPVDLTVPEDYTLEVPKSLTVPTGKSIENNGTIYVDGTLTGNTINNSDTGSVYYLVTVTNGSMTNDSITYKNKTYGKRGDTVTVAAATDTNLHVYSWTAESPTSLSITSSDANKTATFTMPAAAVSVKANFKANMPTGTATPETILGKNDGSFTFRNHNSSATYEISKDGGQTWSNATVSATGTGTDKIYKITDLAAGTYYVRVAANTNYDASEPVEVEIKEGSPIQVTLPETQTGYTLQTDKSGYSYGDTVTITLTLADGYSKTDSFAVMADGSELNGTAEGGTDNSKITYQISKITANTNITVTGIADTTAPTGEIQIGSEDSNKWSSLLNTITFGLFFKKTQAVTITASDAGSGMAADGISYYVQKVTADSDVLALTALQQLPAEKWTTGSSFSIDPDQKCVVYAKLTDQTGNTSYISTNGLVLNGSIRGAVTLAGTAVYGETLTATATLDESWMSEESVKAAKESLTYTFYQEGNTTPLQTGTSNTYTLKGGDTGKRIYVAVTAKGWSGSLTSAKTEAVEKAAAPTITAESRSYCYATGSNGAVTMEVASMLPEDKGDTTYCVTAADANGILSGNPEVNTDGTLTYTVNSVDSSLIGKTAQIAVTAQMANYEDAVYTVDLTIVDKKTTVLKTDSEVKADGSLTYGQKLSELAFANAVFVETGTDTVIEGKLAWSKPDCVPDAATKKAAWIFTPKDANNYKTVTGETAITVTNASQAMPELSHTDETYQAQANGSISGLTDEMEISTSEKSGYTSVTKYIGTTQLNSAKPIYSNTDSTAGTLTGLAAGTYYLRLAAKTNYNASEPVKVEIKKGRLISVTLPTTQIGYTLKTDKSGYSYGDTVTLTLTLADGCSKTDSLAVMADGSKLSGTTKDSTADGSTITYQISKITADTNITVTGIADTTAPTGEIQIGSEDSNKWSSFLDTITFGLFFKETQTVTITASDAGSGMAADSISYYVQKVTADSDVLNLTALQSLSSDKWTTGSSFFINPDQKCVVYAKLTDQAGNTSYISTNGLVLNGSIQGAVTLAGTAVYGETLTATVTLDESWMSENSVETAKESLTYTFYQEGNTAPLQTGTSNTYTLKGGDTGKRIYVAVTANGWSGSLTSDKTEVVKKAENAPNMPDAALTPVHATATVADIALPTGWEWSSADKATALSDGVTVTATAVYTGADQGNYENESVEIEITRESCEHKNKELRNATEAACTTTGYTGDTYCKDCGAKITTGEEVAATGHSYTSKITQEATTTSEGVMTYTCSKCGDSYTEPIAKRSDDSQTDASDQQKDDASATTENPGASDQQKDDVSTTTENATTSKQQKTKRQRKTVSAQPAAGKQKGSDQIQLTWKKEKDADGYEVYWSYCDGKQNYHKAKTIKAADKCAYTHKHLKENRTYKYYIASYKLVQGKKVYIAKSPIFHVAMKNAEYTNAKSIQVNKAKITLAKGKKFTIKASVKKQDKTKKLLSHEPKLRYYTSNKKVAAVSRKGQITAKQKGSATVYVIANNGVYKKIKITVK